MGIQTKYTRMDKLKNNELVKEQQTDKMDKFKNNKKLRLIFGTDLKI